MLRLFGVFLTYLWPERRRCARRRAANCFGGLRHLSARSRVLSRRLGIDCRRPPDWLCTRDCSDPCPPRPRDRFRGRPAPSNGAPVAFARSLLVRRLFSIAHAAFAAAAAAETKMRCWDCAPIHWSTGVFYKFTSGGPKQESRVEGSQCGADAEPRWGSGSVTNMLNRVLIITSMLTFFYFMLVRRVFT